MQAILLAAGKGTRMWPLATRTPKPLLEVAGRSLLWRMLDALAAAGASECIVVVGHGGERVTAAASAWRGGMVVRCVPQGEPRGTGHAVAAAAPHVKEDCLLAMADGLVEAATLQALAQAGGFAVAAQRVADPSRYGALRVQGDRVLGVEEKSERPSSDLVNTGFYRVPLAAVQECAGLRPSPRGELEFTDVLAAWAARGEVRWTAAEGWRDVGAPWDLLVAHEALMGPTLDFLLDGVSSGVAGNGTVEDGVHVRGRLFVEAGAVVKAGTYVEGDVYIGSGARVGPNSYLRGPVAIGAKCHVGAATELKNTILLPGAHAPHLNYVGDSILGEGCNLGAGTVVANLRHDDATVRVHHKGKRVDTGRRKFGAIVGDGAKTGVNASLNPGTLLGPGVLVPAGAAVKGTIES
ncbi:MAG TPA: bifunctional sugar-1-phosphate nucleotidylyltransferase/acetyltransferase [Candidatus Thermoplasmatota archaeon]|nr:bifunctional sugar-1-phosphate nucleotidylyltransferase/acetyltransferase [Candidatus Thermoplasmatota archaeon]